MDKTLARFVSKINVLPNGCWEWTGNRAPNGYGRFWWNGQKGLAHRFAYETYIGPFPNGTEADHLCRNRACVCPEHLEAVSRSENTRRGIAGQLGIMCKQGHFMDERNTYTDPRGHRDCRACHNQRSKEFIKAHLERYAEYARKYRKEKQHA